MANSALPDTPELAAADAAAETLRRTGNDVTLSGVDPSRESALDEAFSAVAAQPETVEALGKENGGVKRPIPGEPAEEPAPEAAEPTPETDPEPVQDPKPAVKPADKAAAPVARKGLLDDVIEEPAAPAEDTPEK